MQRSNSLSNLGAATAKSKSPWIKGLLSLPLLLIGLSAQAETWRAQGVPLEALDNEQESRLLSSDLQPGYQAVGMDLSGPIGFAGKTVDAQNLDAVFGMSSDFAYLMVISGSVSDRAQTLRPGRMLVIPALGTNTRVERFDADLFRRSVADISQSRFADLDSGLQRIAKRQERGKWWGLLRPTGSNLNASRGVDSELDRRVLLGNSAMQQLRFSGLENEAELARKTAENFVAALHRRDSAAVEALLDPTQFGDLGLRGGASVARTVAAQQLLERVVPSEAALVGGISASDNIWRFNTSAGQKSIELRKVDDLYFVASVF